jgi:carbamate kinase
MLVVAALGGNALLRRGEPMTADAQRANVAVAAAALAPLAAQHRLVITHGNGPQVGLLSLQNEAYPEVTAYPLDILDAETEGMIGYLLELEVARHIHPNRVATLLTQVVVDPRDPAFGLPRKFVGPVYDQEQAQVLADARGWTIAPDGDRWRRVVASPEPQGIVEIGAISTLSMNGFTVICAGGGGIPVTLDDSGQLHGSEAVVDKDLVSSRLATELGADALLLLTDVDAVYDDWGTPQARPIRCATPDEIRSRQLPAGSMAPKVEALCRFVEHGGGIAAIGSLERAAELLSGSAGTRVAAAHPDLSSCTPSSPTMRDDEIRALLDQAEADFRRESLEVAQMANPLTPQSADNASETLEREIALGLMFEAKDVQSEIDAARRRLAAGTFGRCEMCGQPIDPERLAVVPWARHCISDERRVTD